MAVFTLHCKIDWLHFSIVTAQLILFRVRDLQAPRDYNKYKSNSLTNTNPALQQMPRISNIFFNARKGQTPKSRNLSDNERRL